MSELLLEIRCAEIPARMQKQGAEDFRRLMLEQLTVHGLEYGEARAYVTPRRLALVIQGIPLTTPDQVVEKRGPRIDAPLQAIQGFLDSMEIDRTACEERSTEKGVFLFATVEKRGSSTLSLLPLLVEKALFSIPWSKSMRWGTGTKSWVRPLHSGICIFRDQTVPFTLFLGNDPEAPKIHFGQTTTGHRFLSPSPFPVSNFKDYQAKLERSFVILDPQERQKKILQGINQLLKDKPYVLKEDPALLDEITGLVEWPVPLLGTIDPFFMTLPPEVLITAMRVHQRYFALQDGKSGHLAPAFICVANTKAQDQGHTILKGNEAVLRARLSDAHFFYEGDLKIPLEEHAQALEKMTFHQDLGSLRDKTRRLQRLACWIAETIQPPREKSFEKKPPSLTQILDQTLVQEGARLCKADLATQMVYEFPELQGIMGSYYAQSENLAPEIIQAIREHYHPRDAQDSCPQSLLGQILALADRVDTLVGFFSVGIQPTGSKDPFALRRSAIGIIRLLEIHHDLCLNDLFKKAYEGYEDLLNAGLNPQKRRSQSDVLDALHLFLLERLKVYWREQGWRLDVITAVFPFSQIDPLWVMKKRLQALQMFLGTEAGAHLLTAYRRSVNIVRIEEKKDQICFSGQVNPALFNLKSEKELYETLQTGKAQIQQALTSKDFDVVMHVLASWRPRVDQYFEEVVVNSAIPEERHNRLETLALIRNTLEQVADFSKIDA